MNFNKHDASNQLSVNIQLEFDKSLPLVLADGLQIKQVILNLLRNSTRAILKVMPPDDMKLNIILSTKTIDSQTIMVSITDEGPGISDDILENMFEPYVTSYQNSMGLGLSICRTIIEMHGGKIMGKSLPTGGACFQFTLPIAYANE